MKDMYLIRVYKKEQHDPTRLIPVADIKVSDDHFWRIDLNKFARRHGGDVAEILDLFDFEDDEMEVY